MRSNDLSAAQPDQRSLGSVSARGPKFRVGRPPANPEWYQIFIARTTVFRDDRSALLEKEVLEHPKTGDQRDKCRRHHRRRPDRSCGARTKQRRERQDQRDIGPGPIVQQASAIDERPSTASPAAGGGPCMRATSALERRASRDADPVGEFRVAMRSGQYVRTRPQHNRFARAEDAIGV